MAERCCICGETCKRCDSTAVLTPKGAESINQISSYQGVNINAKPGTKVHQRCRLNLVRCNKPCKAEENLETPVGRRSTTPKFSLPDNCIFCGQTAKYDGRKKGFEVLPVKTREFQESIAKICRERCDDWSLVVLGRLEYAQDLNATQAVYHQSCSVNFRTGKQLPKQYVDLVSYGAKRIKQ